MSSSQSSTSPQADIARAFSATISLLFTFALLVIGLTGCKTTPPSPATATPNPRPTTPPAPFKLFHQTDNSYILVTPTPTPDPALAALLYQLRDAANAHTFAQLHLSQSFIDARHPKIFFHMYRGPKCAPETYSKPYPCGASYHGAADFSFGGFSNPNATDGSLVAPDGTITHLWNPE